MMEMLELSTDFKTTIITFQCALMNILETEGKTENLNKWKENRKKNQMKILNWEI